ncbi:MAG: molybdopterin-dependent oxidoreductase [Candidatus Hodarchaeales archaeon]
MKPFTITTVCPRDCYDTCSLKVKVDDSGYVEAVRVDSINPFTRGYTCRRATNDHVRILRNRVLHPFIRKRDSRNAKFEKTSWNEALSLVTDKLQQTIAEHGSKTVLRLDYAGNTGLLTWNFPRRIWNAIGATKTDYSICSKSGHEALYLHYGSSYGIQPEEELVNKKFIVYWGFNAKVSSPHSWNLSRRAKKQGTTIAVIDPRKSESAEKSDIWLSPRPGSDVALAYGIIRSIIEQEYVNKDFIDQWTRGYDSLEKEALKWTPKRVEEFTGIEWEEIEKIAKYYGELKPSATMIGIGLQKNVHGAEAVRAAALIPAILGLHRGFFYSNGHKYLIDFPYLSRKDSVNETLRTVSQVGLSKIVERGEFKFIYIYNMNPAVTIPCQKAFRAGLSRNDVFVVVHETHWNKTTEFADVVLPAPSFLEKDDLVIPWSHRYVRLSNKAVNPLGESHDEIWVMRQLGRRLDLKDEWLYEDPFKVLEKLMKNVLENGTFDDLKDNKLLTLICKPMEEYQTPSGKIEFLSTTAENSGLNPLPTQYPMDRNDGEFVLLNSSLSQYTHTQFQEVQGPIPAIVKINPVDAEDLEINVGDTVHLYNRDVTISVIAEISETVPKGVLWSPRQLTGLNGEPQNSLTSCKTQKIGKGPTFNSTIVKLSKP